VNGPAKFEVRRFTRSRDNREYPKNYSVQNDESLRGHCTNERRVRKRDKKVRRDVISDESIRRREKGQQ